MLEMLLKSIELFMRCHGTIQIMVGEEVFAAVQIWIISGGKNIMVDAKTTSFRKCDFVHKTGMYHDVG